MILQAREKKGQTREGGYTLWEKFGYTPPPLGAPLRRPDLDLAAPRPPARGWEYYGYAMDAVGHDYVSALTHAGSCPQCFYVFPPIWEAAPAYF